MQPNLTSHARVAHLDGLRGIAILAVVLGHSATASALMGAYAQLGVRVFFVLSGYLITALLLAEREKHGALSLPKFYMRRSLRIFPAFYAYLFVVACLAGLGVLSFSPGAWAVAATYLWNYSHFILPSEGYHPAFAHFWTLAMEEQFYLLFPALLMLLKPRGMLWFSAMCVCLLPILRVLAYLYFPQQRGYFMLMLHTGADPILWGVLGALCMHGTFKNRSRLAGVLHKFIHLFTKPGPFKLGALLVFVCILSPWLAATYKGTYFLPIGIAADAVCTLLLVCALQAGQAPKLSKLLSARWLVHIGVLSYSIYLWQQLFLLALPKSVMPLALGLVCTAAAAYASYTCIEKPALRFKKYFVR